MLKRIQLDNLDDFVIEIREAHSDREYLDEAFGYAGLDWQEYVRIDGRDFCLNEVDYPQVITVNQGSDRMGTAGYILRRGACENS